MTEPTPIPRSDEIDLGELFRKLWKSRKTIWVSTLIFGLAGILIALVITLASPREYSKSVTMLLQIPAEISETIPLPLLPAVVQSSSFQQELRQQLVTDPGSGLPVPFNEYLSNHIHPSVGQVIRMYTIGLPGRILRLIGKKPVQNPVSLSERITAQANAQENTLTLTIRMQDPTVTAQITDSVMQNITQYVVLNYTRLANNDLRFIRDRLSEAKSRFERIREALITFRTTHRDYHLAAVEAEEEYLQTGYNLAFNDYTALSQLIEQTTANIRMIGQTSVFIVIDPGSVAPVPPKPSPGTTLILCLFLGIITGIAIVLVRSAYQVSAD